MTRSTARGGRRGFTILEILVAISAVVIVSAGLAAVFDSIGKTVAAGRRVSRVTQYGRLLEQTMRKDFERIARDGVLVIRQQFADVNGDFQFDPLTDRVPLYEDQEAGQPGQADAWRRRRVDEVLFFARGNFESARLPVATSRGWETPDSNEAMIYYGHGMLMRPRGNEATAEPGRLFKNPHVNETNTPARNQTNQTSDPHTLGFVAFNPANIAPSTGRNPNVFASQWILARHQTLLVPPSPTSNDRAGIFGHGPNSVILLDKETQVAGQPAAATVFRSLNRYFAPDFAGTAPFAQLDEHLWYIADTGGEVGNHDPLAGDPDFVVGPQLASGIVDIATTSLSEVRGFLYGYADVGSVTRRPGNYTWTTPSRRFPASMAQFDVNWGVPDQRPDVASWESLDYIHAWMDNLMPGRASAHGNGNSPTEGAQQGTWLDYDDADRGVRIRVDNAPPDLFAVLDRPTTSDDERRRAQFARADRLMAGFNSLVAGCSEFVVDWSFGTVSNNPGEIRWYGPETPCGFYEYSGNSSGGPGQCEYEFGTGVFVRGADGSALPNQAYPITDRLIYGYRPNLVLNQASGQFPLSVSSFFGGIDPTYVTSNPSGPAPNELALEPIAKVVLASGDVVEVANATPSQRQWRWPSLVRVRVTIADPVDPQVESTFEYVFDIPDSDVR